MPSAEIRAATNRDNELNEFYSGYTRSQKRTQEIPALDDRTAKQKAFESGLRMGDSVGKGINQGAKFVDRASRELVDRIPENFKKRLGTLPELFGGLFQGLRSQFKALEEELPIFGQITGGIKGIALAAGAGFVGFQLFDTLRQQAGATYEAIKKLETARVVTRFATGDTSALAEAEKQSDRLGTRLDESRNAIKSLSIQSKNTPLEGEVTPVFQGVSTGIAAFQLNQEQQQRAFLAFNQIAGKGTVQAEELRQQLGELGFSFTLAARAAGVTTQEFNKQLEQGAVLSQDFLPKYARQLKLELGGAAIAAGDSLQGLENKTINAAQKLREELGERSLPLVSTGLKLASSTLDFAANNIDKFTALINVGLVAALAKGAIALTQFALAEQLVAIKSGSGALLGTVGVPRIGVAVQNIKNFATGGGLAALATSIAPIVAGTVAIQAGLTGIQIIQERFTGNEKYQEFNKTLEITKKRIQEINEEEAKRNKTESKGLGYLDPERGKGISQNILGGFGKALTFDFKGAIDSYGRAAELATGGNPDDLISNNFFKTEEQRSNQRILESAQRVAKDPRLEATKKRAQEYVKAIKEEKQIVSKADFDAGKVDRNKSIIQEDVDSIRQKLQAEKEVLEATPENLRKLDKDGTIQKQIDELKQLIDTLGGTGSAFTALQNAVSSFNLITLKQIELTKALNAARTSRGRADLDINEYEAKTSENADLIETTKQTRSGLAKQIELSDKYLGSTGFELLKKNVPQEAEKKESENIELRK
ncbi:MAG: tape measure protein, partial [Alphaproteobacteria bacterium]